MKARIDREQTGEKRVVGVTMKLIGRIRGADRASKKEVKVGKQRQQNRMSRITEASGAVQTKHGIMGLRVQSGVEVYRERNKIHLTVRRVGG